MLCPCSGRCRGRVLRCSDALARRTDWRRGRREWLRPPFANLTSTMSGSTCPAFACCTCGRTLLLPLAGRALFRFAFQGLDRLPHLRGGCLSGGCRRRNCRLRRRGGGWFSVVSHPTAPIFDHLSPLVFASTRSEISSLAPRWSIGPPKPLRDAGRHRNELVEGDGTLVVLTALTLTSFFLIPPTVESLRPIAPCRFRSGVDCGSFRSPGFAAPRRCSSFAFDHLDY